MKMGAFNGKYEKVLNLLKNSKPALRSTDDIEREVIRRISQESRTAFSAGEIFDFIFSWIYIGWVRRSLITVSGLLLILFIWQQGLILKQIDYLSHQGTLSASDKSNDPADKLEKRLMVYKLSGKGFHSGEITISEKQMDMLIESVNDLQDKYKNLLDMIEEEPELKKYIEKKLVEKSNKKLKL